MELMEEHGMLANIRRHSIMVARVAMGLVKGLNSGGPAPPRELCLAGALLHDIAKTPCLRESCNHALLGGEICRGHGYPEVAAIVEEHVILREFHPERYQAGRFTAGEIVYYADKRVRHEEIVGLEARLAYILESYGGNDPERRRLIHANFECCRQLEAGLFGFLDFNAQEMGARIVAEDQL